MITFFLERGKATDILLALLERDRNITELQFQVKGSLSTIEARIEELIKDGFVTPERWKKWPFKRVLKLTEKGVQMAKSLQGLQSIAREGLPKKREKWILALLYALGPIKGSTKLVKLLFLLSKKKEAKGPMYEFNWYKYGPYSDEIISDAHELENVGLIRIEEEIFEEAGQDLEDYKTRFSYDLTELGSKIAKTIFDELPQENKKSVLSLTKYNRSSLNMLLRYVYSEFQPGTETS